MLLIEFAGNAGVGKSTVCDKTVRLLAEKGVPAESIYRNELLGGWLSRKLFSLRYRLYPGNRELWQLLKSVLARYPGKGSTDSKNRAQSMGMQSEAPVDVIAQIA